MDDLNKLNSIFLTLKRLKTLKIHFHYSIPSKFSNNIIIYTFYKSQITKRFLQNVIKTIDKKVARVQRHVLEIYIN